MGGPSPNAWGLVKVQEGAQRDTSFSWLASTLDSSSGSASDSDSSDARCSRRSKKKNKRMRELIKSADEKISKLEEDRKTLQEQVSSSKSLHTAVETHLTPVKPGTSKQATLDRAGWDELMRRTAPVVPVQRGMFNEFFDEEEQEPQEEVTRSVLLKLEEKMKDEEESESFNDKPGKVSSAAEVRIKEVSQKFADLHFPGNDQSSDCFKVLLNIKTTYISTNASKQANTITAAILRSLTARRVEVFEEELGLS